MTDTLITTLIVVSTAAGVIAWDIYVAFFNRTPNSQDTISGQLLAASKRVTGMPFAAGALMGHLFWERPGGPLFSQPLAVLLLSAFALLVCIVGLFRPPRWLVFVWIIAGVLGGYLLWSQ
jgi:hypothetical protein